jgi:hypothetical protein
MRVGVADPRVVQKRLARASDTLDRALLDAIRNVFGPRAQRRIDAWRRKEPLPAAELDRLATDVASVLDAMAGADDAQPGETGRELE